jgi:hypothetical protein
MRKLKLWVVVWENATDEEIGRTACGTRRGAIVNWLAAGPPQTLAMNLASDAAIYARFELEAKKHHAEVREVTVL